jgi:hypothetical protein
MVRYSENGAYHTLTFAQFCDLPLDERVRLLLVGKPRFFKGDSEVPRLRALARQGEA